MLFVIYDGYLFICLFFWMCGLFSFDGGLLLLVFVGCLGGCCVCCLIVAFVVVLFVECIGCLIVSWSD